MKSRIALLPVTTLVVSILACNLSSATSTPLSPADIQTLSAQTLIAMQWQTMMAQGTSLPQPGTTAIATAGPEDTSTGTLLPSVTQTVFAPSVTSTSTMTNTPVPCNWAQFISDISIPDGWETTPVDHFTKTWRLKNIGSCTWTSGYSLVFDHGDQMSAPASQQLTPGTVAPGATIDVSVNLISPAAPGTYQGFFKLRASDSSTFGIGADAGGAFWVKIVVNAGTPTPTVQQVSSSITITPGSTNSTTAACPAGTVATGGGFSVGLDVLVYTQAKNGNGWTAVAKNNAGVNRPMVVYAECLTYPSAATIQVENNISVNAGSFASQTAVCPAGSIVTGGGYTSSPDGTMWTYASWQNGNAWQVSELNSGGAAKTFNVYATCLSGVPLTTAKVNNTGGDIPAHGNGFVEVACPAGKVATGGGFGLGTNELPYFSGFSSGYWRVYVHNSNASVASLLATVTCLG